MAQNSDHEKYNFLVTRTKWAHTQIKEKYHLKLNNINLSLLILFLKFRHLDAKKEARKYIFTLYPYPYPIAMFKNSVSTQFLALLWDGEGVEVKSKKIHFSYNLCT